MRGFLKNILKLLIFITVIGVLTAVIDYTRMSGGEVPIFNISKYDSNTKTQSYRGLFYQAKRHIRVSTSESLVDSNNIEYVILNHKLNIPRQYKDLGRELSIKTKVSNNCSNSLLYYADTNIKVYTYCLDSIDVVENNKTKSLYKYLESDKKIINNIEDDLTFTGVYSDNSTLMFSDIDNMSNNGLSLYQCNKTNINDVYIAPSNTDMLGDFCSYKDDDFKFISEIHEEKSSTDGVQEKGAEVFYQDDKYIYEFDEPMLDRIYVTTPAVRGKSETSTPLRDVLNNHLLTIDELQEKGLKFKKIDKSKLENSNS